MESGNSLVQRIMLKEPERSVYELDYAHCDTFRFGEIKPIFQQHCLPGDKVRLDSQPFVRCTPLLAPIFGNIDVTLHYFFVPYRLIWDDWQEFITGGRLGVSEPLLPYMGSPTPLVDVNNNYRLLDSLGMLRTDGNGNGYTPYKVSTLPFRAYWKIIDDYYRDQNLQESYFDPDSGNPALKTSSGVDSINIFTPSGGKLGNPYHRAWRKDMFTSALPFPQRGAQVELPVGVGNNVILDNDIDQFRLAGDVSDTSVSLKTDAPDGTNYHVRIGGTDVGAVGIEDLREANAIQRWLERNAIAGGRYNEQILSHFNVQVPDFRLQRPEYICGVTSPLMISQVVQQSQSTSDSALGDLGGHGVSAGEMETAEYFCYEHGVILGLMSITPRAVYSQGVHRNNLKFDKFDFGWPLFENLGEQEILNAELFATATVDDFGTFGYEPRYAEYKMKSNEVHGQFRTSLDYWIPQRKFAALPALNKDFITVNPANEGSLNNIFAITDADYDPFQVVVQNYSTTIRSLSAYSKFSF